MAGEAECTCEGRQGVGVVVDDQELGQSLLYQCRCRRRCQVGKLEVS
jgi:hypothetical protein